MQVSSDEPSSTTIVSILAVVILKIDLRHLRMVFEALKAGTIIDMSGQDCFLSDMVYLVFDEGVILLLISYQLLVRTLFGNTAVG